MKDWLKSKRLNKHNVVIDMLRFFAAFSVVLFHLNQSTITVHNWYRNIINFGWIGVPIFFVISGYCIIMSAYNSKSMSAFITKRFFRIFPPYWFSLLVVGFAAVFQKIYLGSNGVHSLPHNTFSVIAVLTLTSAPFSSVKISNWVYWSLTCEMLFYLVIYISLFLNKKYIVLFLIFVSFVAAICPPQHTGLWFFLDQWPAFGCGLSVFFYFEASNKRNWIEFGLLLLVNIIGLYIKFGNNVGYTVATLSTVILILVSNYIVVKNNILSSFGQISYSVYLIHVPLGVFVISLFESVFIQTHPIVNLIYDLVVYAIISCLSWVMFKMVEQPSIAYGHKIAKRNVTVETKINHSN